MIKHFFPNPVVFERLLAGPLGAHIDAFAQEMADRGCALWTAKQAMLKFSSDDAFMAW